MAAQNDSPNLYLKLKNAYNDLIVLTAHAGLCEKIAPEDHPMPELPEVQTVADQLAPLLCGRRIVRFETFDPKLALEAPERAIGRQIQSVSRLGKQVLLELAAPDVDPVPLWLAVHLRMTGRLVWREAEPDPATTRPPRARLTLDRGFLFFQDTRRFGTMCLSPTLDCFQPAGLEPFSPAFTSKAFAALLAGGRMAIKPWLLRQDRLVGMGNIYASEALFEARIHPERLAGALTPAETRRLQACILKVLRWGIAHGGTTFSDFQNGHGEAGRFQDKLKVYGRDGQPCRRCAAPVLRLVQQGRSTFYCPGCQPLS